MSGKTAPPGTGQEMPVTDVSVMRALAHPVRLALMEHLGVTGPATATECAEVVGQSPSAVSYHLRALARAGLVEAAPGRGDGRERLWRAVASRINLDIGEDDTPELREARQEVLESLLGLDHARARQFLARLDTEPREWQDATLYMYTTLLVTAAELQELGEAIRDLLAPYKPSSRTAAPAGARTVSTLVRALPG
jgi:DNA-binding transcriptional ArsR family regulator